MMNMRMMGRNRFEGGPGWIYFDSFSALSPVEVWHFLKSPWMEHHRGTSEEGYIHEYDEHRWCHHPWFETRIFFIKNFDKYLASKASKIVFCFTQFILTLVNGGKWWEKYPCLSGLIQLGDESSASILHCFVVHYIHISIYAEIFINIIIISICSHRENTQNFGSQMNIRIYS